jgi:hypothetical protein
MTIVAGRAFYAVDFLTKDFRQRFCTTSAQSSCPPVTAAWQSDFYINSLLANHGWQSQDPTRSGNRKLFSIAVIELKKTSSAAVQRMNHKKYFFDLHQTLRAGSMNASPGLTGGSM